MACEGVSLRRPKGVNISSGHVKVSERREPKRAAGWEPRCINEIGLKDLDPLPSRRRYAVAIDPLAGDDIAL